MRILIPNRSEVVRLRRLPSRDRRPSSCAKNRNGIFPFPFSAFTSFALLTPLSPPSCQNSDSNQVFACKKCKKAFRKDGETFEESDEYCPHCDNHFVLEAVTPKPMLKFEGEDARVDSRMIKDERIRGEETRTIFDVKDAPNKLG
jgi:hypothetical protein